MSGCQEIGMGSVWQPARVLIGYTETGVDDGAY